MSKQPYTPTDLQHIQQLSQDLLEFMDVVRKAESCGVSCEQSDAQCLLNMQYLQAMSDNFGNNPQPSGTSGG